MISPHSTRGSECSQVTKAHPALTMVMVGAPKSCQEEEEERSTELPPVQVLNVSASCSRAQLGSCSLLWSPFIPHALPWKL